jgi:hypothetical protein
MQTLIIATISQIVVASEKATDVQDDKFKGGWAKGKWVIYVLVRVMGGRDVCF